MQARKSHSLLNQNDFQLLGTGSEYKIYQDDGFTKKIDLDKNLTTLKK